MSELRLTRRRARGDPRGVGLLRIDYELEVTELVELVLAGPRVPEVVDRAFDLAGSHLRLGVRPDDVRTWLLVLARELALNEARDEPGPLAVATDDCPLLAYERTILHLHRRAGIAVDALAAALSIDRMRLWMELVRLERRFFDMVALRVLVAEADSPCGMFSLHSAESDPRFALERAREHARTCLECRSWIEARCRTTDALGRAAAPASAFVEEAGWRARRRRRAPAAITLLVP